MVFNSIKIKDVVKNLRTVIYSGFGFFFYQVMNFVHLFALFQSHFFTFSESER